MDDYKNRIAITLLFLSGMLLGLPAGAAGGVESAGGTPSASNTSDGIAPNFSLRAVVEERPQLSREDVNPEAMGLRPVRDRATESSAAPPVAAAILPPAGPLHDQWAQTRAAPASGPGNVMETGANRALAEYNVDWSGWIGQFADRWYYNLKILESRCRMQFHTTRPALFKFTCYPDGRVGNVSLEQSSGIPLYDQLQLQALSQVMPLPPFPAGTERKSLTLIQGWESHPRRPGEQDYRPGSFGREFPKERVSRWVPTY